MLSGDLLPSSGSAAITGHDVVSEQHKLRRQLGYCPQENPLFDLLTVSGGAAWPAPRK